MKGDTKAIQCLGCGSHAYRLLFIKTNGRGPNRLRLICNKCHTHITFAVGGRAVNKGPARRKNKEELL